MKVAYQGIEGSYSEVALFKHFGKNVKAVGHQTFEEVFEAVKKNKADCGILPFENTITGSLAMNYSVLLEEELYVIAEVFLKIRHNLLSHKGNKVENIKFVYSHPQALEQCKDYIKKQKIEPVPEYDTAGAAKLVKERNKMEEAAIASELCSKIYGLEILGEEIEKNKNNITKFFVFVKKEKIPKNLKKEKTSIAFKTKHFPGALVSCLQRLAKNNINLTKLESRPIPENPWEYIFYADFIGDVDGENVKLALSEMEATLSFIKILGSYPLSNKYS
ncbi:prephenate dehydratase [Candidatus Woesearchaeota archaeon]|nr:prephenate dehydratase [Candidatus Woesearchaeota archaeon]|tara:strand:- start:3168 stop:3995 length:828 start_codon:yes stop_codon:yes gene_type:complete